MLRSPTSTDREEEVKQMKIKTRIQGGNSSVSDRCGGSSPLQPGGL
jgi:hypothetical protein